MRKSSQLDQAKPEHLSKNDILRAKKNVDKIKCLFKRGITPEYLIKKSIEMINPGSRHSRDRR